MIKTTIVFILAIAAVVVFSGGGLSVTPVARGGTGDSSLTGILFGNNRNPVSSLHVGSNLTLSHDTLSATGGGGTAVLAGGELSNVRLNYYYGIGRSFENSHTNTNPIDPSYATVAPSNGVLSKFTVHGSTSLSGDTSTVVVYDNGSATSLAAKVIGTVQFGSDNIHTAAVNQGDLIMIRQIRSDNGDWTAASWSCLFTPTP